MALYTQKAIMRAFGEMLEEMPFDKITVTALVKRCDISSNTFYYHYRDIYDLLDAWFHLELGRFTGEGTDWHTSTKAVMRECQAHPAKIYHVFNALSRDRMEQYVFSLTDGTFFRLLGGGAPKLTSMNERPTASPWASPCPKIKDKL